MTQASTIGLVRSAVRTGDGGGLRIVTAVLDCVAAIEAGLASAACHEQTDAA